MVTEIKGKPMFTCQHCGGHKINLNLFRMRLVLCTECEYFVDTDGKAKPSYRKDDKTKSSRALVRWMKEMRGD